MGFCFRTPLCMYSFCPLSRSANHYLLYLALSLLFRCLGQLAAEYLTSKPEKALVALSGRPPLGTALTAAHENEGLLAAGVGTTRVKSNPE